MPWLVSLRLAREQSPSTRGCLIDSVHTMVDTFLGLTPEQWEATRNWLATIGGLIALLVALNTYRHNVKNKREEQARLVYSRVRSVNRYLEGEPFTSEPGPPIQDPSIAQRFDPNDSRHYRAVVSIMQIEVCVHNGSKELIGPAKAQMMNLRTGLPDDWQSVLVTTIEPESDATLHFLYRANAEDLRRKETALPETTVIFRDASGQWWRRHGSEPIERVHADPESNYPTPSERVLWREYYTSQGLRAGPEPTVPWSVVWSRYWRRVRGKSPIP